MRDVRREVLPVEARIRVAFVSGRLLPGDFEAASYCHSGPIRYWWGVSRERYGC